MTVVTTNSRIFYTGDGSSTSFAVSYPFLTSADLQVYVAGVLQTLTTDYTVSGGDDATGTVVFNTAPGASTAIVIARVMSITQPTDYENNDNSDAKVIERSFDRLVMQVQQNEDQLSRSVFVPVTTSQSFDALLPTPTANGVLMFNSSADGFTTGPSAEDIADAETNAAAAAASASAASTSAATAAAQAAIAQAAAGSVTLMIRDFTADFTVSVSQIQFSERYIAPSTHNLILQAGADVTII